MKILAPLLALALVVLPVPLMALSVSPMGVYLEPASGTTYTTVTAVNQSDRPVVIETYSERRMPDGAGGETLVPADDEFIVFPPIRSIPPGASQAFRIQWIGDPRPAAMQRYYVTIAQLPVSVDEAEKARPTAAAGKASVMLRLGYAFRVSVTVGR